MILTWLWKLLLGLRRRGEAPALEAPAPAAPKPLAEDYAPNFINHSTDQNNSQVVIFGDDGPEVIKPAPRSKD